MESNLVSQAELASEQAARISQVFQSLQEQVSQLLDGLFSNPGSKDSLKSKNLDPSKDFLASQANSSERYVPLIKQLQLLEAECVWCIHALDTQDVKNKLLQIFDKLACQLSQKIMDLQDSVDMLNTLENMLFQMKQSNHDVSSLAHKTALSDWHVQGRIWLSEFIRFQAWACQVQEAQFLDFEQHFTSGSMEQLQDTHVTSEIEERFHPLKEDFAALISRSQHLKDSPISGLDELMSRQEQYKVIVSDLNAHHAQIISSQSDYQDAMLRAEQTMHATFHSLSASRPTQESDAKAADLPDISATMHDTLHELRAFHESNVSLVRQASQQLDALQELVTGMEEAPDDKSYDELIMARGTLVALCNIRETHLRFLQQMSQRLEHLFALREEIDPMLNVKQRALETMMPKIAWQEPGARQNASNYWKVYCGTEQMLFDYLSEEKEHSISRARLQLYLNDMTFYLGAAIYTTLCYEQHLASEDKTRACWLAAALCLHVCRRELHIPWHPDDIVGQLVEKVKQPALRILEALDPKLAALVSGNALEGHFKYFGQSLRQASFAFLESIGVSSLLPMMQEGLYREITALGKALAPYLGAKHYASNLKTLRDNLAWRSKRSQILREDLRATEQAEAQARFETSILEIQKEVTKLGGALADLLEAEVRNNPAFAPHEEDRLYMLADCARMRGAARAVASIQTQGLSAFSQDMGDELALLLAGVEDCDEKSDSNASTSLS